MLFLIHTQDEQSKTAQINIALVSLVLPRATGKKGLRALAHILENPLNCHVLKELLASKTGFLELLFIYGLHINQVHLDKGSSVFQLKENMRRPPKSISEALIHELKGYP